MCKNKNEFQIYLRSHLVSFHCTIVRNFNSTSGLCTAIGWKITRISQVVWQYEGRKRDVLGLSHILILMRVCKVIGVQTTLIHFVEELIYRLVQQTSIYSMYLLCEDQRYKHRVLQTIQMKRLCVWAILGSVKTSLKFKYNIEIG